MQRRMLIEAPAINNLRCMRLGKEQFALHERGCFARQLLRRFRIRHPNSTELARELIGVENSPALSKAICTQIGGF